nr:hypothetical protein [Armatimonadota bacterium]
MTRTFPLYRTLTAVSLILGMCGALPASRAEAPAAPVPLLPGYAVTAASHVRNSQALRGYGPVDATFYDVRSIKTGNGLLLARFATVSHWNAVTLAAKFMADLTLSPGVGSRTVNINGRSYHVIAVQNGFSYTAVVIGPTAYIAAGPSGAALGNLIASNPLFSTPNIEPNPTSYPSFLDRFDRYGWGFYGI